MPVYGANTELLQYRSPDKGIIKKITTILQAGFEPASANTGDFKPPSLDQLGHCSAVLTAGLEPATTCLKGKRSTD